MKIAHIVSTFSPRAGGMGAVCHNEARLLAQRGHDVTVFTLKYSDAAPDDAKFNFKVERLKPIIRMGDAGFVPQLFWKLRKNFDLAHLHYPFYGGAEWLCFLNIPFVVTYHMDAHTAGAKMFIQKIYDLFWPRLIFAEAKKIIAVDIGHFNETKFGRIFKNKTVEIANGVDMEIFQPRAADLSAVNLGHLAGKKIILFVGNAMPLKRLDLLINAVKLINNLDAVLVVVGGGYELERYKRMVKNLKMDNKVVFAGQCDNARRLADYYNAAACVAVPSDYESFSLVAAEAMACGIPVIAASATGAASRISHGIDGFLFEKSVMESLAGFLNKMLLLSGEERKKMGELGREKAVGLYDWSKHIAKLEEVYAEIIDKQ